MLSHLKFLPAVLCLQEIWSSHANLEIPGYHYIEFYSRDMNTLANYNCGGGVGIFVRKDLNYQVLNIKNSVLKGVFESFWIKLETANNGTKIIGCCYRPNTAPLASVPAFNIAMEEILSNLRLNYCKANLIVAGDFNIE